MVGRTGGKLSIHNILIQTPSVYTSESLKAYKTLAFLCYRLGQKCHCIYNASYSWYQLNYWLCEAFTEVVSYSC